jgi:hypothetical protein
MPLNTARPPTEDPVVLAVTVVVVVIVGTVATEPKLRSSFRKRTQIF